ncbi:MFS general substrate transporter [Guyanagaster necrorhizus]|uniref:MFS general substrate transporter n=1 Tax=Guyanagaster necrorhizus TaxID=856835 RepID=A0A9P7VWG5_9AGAR|nr:MFS general substrate transporter [Guyanagaster necrorhizus MCA 3950]KAG7448801.1 MFS general substrate transporter [Guyanagaster necrorhizus MCA 3950]
MKIVLRTEERRLVRRLDGRILPLACLLYLFAYLDRSNLGNARLQGLPQDILNGDPTGVLFDWITSAFYFSYIICQIPATIVSKLVPPHYWLAGAAVGWGLSSTLMSTAFNFGGLFTARVFLGIFEAGFGPGIPLYFSLFYTREEMGLRMAYWFGFAAVSGAFGGLIAFGISMSNVTIAHWRLLLIVEGVPTIILGIISFFSLPNRPEVTHLFNSRERELAIARMNRSASGDVGNVVNKAHIWMAFRDWRIYTGGVIYFGLNCALASISAFLPTIIQTFGNTAAVAQLLTVPPYAVSAVVLTLFSYASDRLQTRGCFMAVASTIGAIGYLLLLTVSSNNHVRYFATFCITSGTYTTIGLIIAWFAHNLGSETKRATGIPMFMAIGQCGSVLGSHIFPETEGPEYTKGFAISCALEFLAAICAIILHFSYRLENKRRNICYGIPDYNVRVDTSEVADKAPDFRYVT